MRVFTRDTAAGAWVERSARTDGISVSDTVNERSTASVNLIDATGALRFARGHGVRITNDAADEDLFVGFVAGATEGRLGLAGAREHALDCTDLHYLADKRVVAAAFQEQHAGTIVGALITNYLTTEGITPGLIQPGPIVRAITFNYVTVADAITDLAERAGFWWRIAPDGTLSFAEALEFLSFLAGSTTTLAGSASLLAGASTGEGSTPTATDLAAVALADTVSVTRHAPAYRNRQWIKGGRDRTSEQTEVQHGDGEARAFVLGYPIASAPTIQVSRNGGAWFTETTGEAGVFDEGQWTYAIGRNSVRQNTSGTVLAAVDRVRVVYEGFFDVIVRVENADLQTERALVEGGTGVVESVLADGISEGRDAAFQLASELIAYYGRAATSMRFATLTSGWEPGQVRDVTFSEAGITNEEALVTSVERFSRAQQDHALVTLVVGPLEGSWAQWFGALSRRLDRLANDRGGEAEVITTLEEFTKVWTAVETPNIFRETRAGTAVAGASTFPEFETQDRVVALAWSYANVELGRKLFTTQAGAATSEVLTTTLLTTSDAVGDIDEFVWFGGHQASAVAGSGLVVDRQAFVRLKTDIEQVVVEKTDQKWS